MSRNDYRRAHQQLIDTPRRAPPRQRETPRGTPWWLQALIWVGIATVPAFAFVQCSNDRDPPAYEIAPDES